MGADTSHSPKHIDRLLSELEADCDMVVASRFGEGASADSASEIGPRMGAWAVTLLARPLVKCSDPMCSFLRSISAHCPAAVQRKPSSPLAEVPIGL